MEKKNDVKRESLISNLKILKDKMNSADKIPSEKKDSTEKIKIVSVLQNNSEGLSLEEIIEKTGLSEEKILIELQKLEKEKIVGNNETKSTEEIKKSSFPKNVSSVSKTIKKINSGVEKKGEGPLNALNVGTEIEHDLENKKIKIEKISKESPEKKEEVVSNVPKIKTKVEKKIKENNVKNVKSKKAQILEQRAPIKKVLENIKEKKPEKKAENYVLTGVQGFDSLLERGIPKGSSIIVAGGAGSGKTIFGLQILAHHALKGKKCFYMSFEENEKRLIEHMNNFEWDAESLIKKGNLKIQRINPFDISRSVDAMLAKQKGELLIEVDPIILPKDFNPDFIVVDSLTSIASTFVEKEENYRIYIEQLFRFFEKLDATSFLITETKQIPEIFSTTGVEEFLADGVIVFYNLKRGNIREKAMEILKLRGAKHQRRMVAMTIEENIGIKIYPEQEILGDIK